VVEGVSCFELGGGSEVVEVEVGVSFGGLDDPEGPVSGDVVVVVVVAGVGETLDDDGTTGERGFWRGMRWTS
jgi:hypothetical protein